MLMLFPLPQIPWQFPGGTTLPAQAEVCLVQQSFVEKIFWIDIGKTNPTASVRL